LPVELAKLAYLLIGDHREPPWLGASMMDIGSQIGNSNCR
jgi:hypothetical protein